jgi:glycine cleavage system H protein
MNMPEFLETTVDKFTFKVATDRFYTREGVWASPLPQGEGVGVRVRVGLSDFLQQRSGDIAFAEVKPIGTTLAAGDEVAAIETIKVNVVLSSPVSGRVIEVNPAMDTAPEAINQDPYGAGWLAVLAPSDWDADRSRLLDAAAYFEVVKREAEEEMKKQ